MALWIEEPKVSHRMLYELMKEHMVLIPGEGWHPFGIEKADPVPTHVTKQTGSSSHPEGGDKAEVDLSRPSTDA